MPVSVSWYNEEKTIVFYNFEGAWTWNELYPVYDKALEMEKAQPHRVDVIMDFRRSKNLPPNALTHLKGITDRQPANIGLSIFVTTNRFMNVMFDIAIKVHPKVIRYFVIVETIEAAEKLIAENIAKEKDESK